MVSSVTSWQERSRLDSRSGECSRGFPQGSLCFLSPSKHMHVRLIGLIGEIQFPIGVNVSECGRCG